MTTLDVCHPCAASYQLDCSYRNESWGFQNLQAMEEHRPSRAIKDSHSYFQPLVLNSCLFQGNVVLELKLCPCRVHPPLPPEKKKAPTALKVFPILKALSADSAFCSFVFVGQENTHLFKNICGWIKGCNCCRDNKRRTSHINKFQCLTVTTVIFTVTITVLRLGNRQWPFIMGSDQTGLGKIWTYQTCTFPFPGSFLQLPPFLSLVW